MLPLFHHSYIDQIVTKLTLQFNVAQFYFIYTNMSFLEKIDVIRK